MINTNENHPLAQVRLCSDLYDPSIPISQTVKSSSQNSAVDRSIRQIEDWALSHTKRIMVAMDESESAVDAFDWAVDNLVLRGDQGGGESGGSSSSSSSRSTGEPAGSKDLVVVAAVIEEREALDLFYGDRVSGGFKLDHMITVTARRIMDQAKQRMEAAIKEKMKMKSAAAAAAPPSSSSPSPLASSADLPPPDILVHVVIGNPKERLMEIAQEWDVSCIVVGPRGRGALKRMLLGSVSTSLLHHSAATSTATSGSESSLGEKVKRMPSIVIARKSRVQV